MIYKFKALHKVLHLRRYKMNDDTNNTPNSPPHNELMRAGKDVAADFSALTLTAYAGFEKITEFNLSTAKAAMNHSFNTMQAVSGAKTPQEIIELHSKMALPLSEKIASYHNIFYGIISETAGEFSKIYKKFFDFQKITTQNNKIK